MATMKEFGGPAILLDRSDINTDEIIPAKYLTEISKTALKTHLLEDLLLDGKPFAPPAEEMAKIRVVITRANFGCGSSREHAVWVFEVNNINVIIAESFARIFRQNMFNCGILAVELEKDHIDALFAMKGRVSVQVDLQRDQLSASSDVKEQEPLTFTFRLNSFDKELVAAGGWLPYADRKY
jgi:3-isopropylmalate/(R)-2-methylmalate dehydratase small subunit